MTSATARWLGGLVLAGALFPSGVSAQTPARSFDELQRILKAREWVVVVDRAGQKTLGEVERVSATSLILVPAEETASGVVIRSAAENRTTFAEDSVIEILRADSSGQTERQIYLAVVRSLKDLRWTVKEEQRLRLTTSDGEMVRGRFQGIDASRLLLRTADGIRAFSDGGVREVRREADPLWDGALIGAAVGIPLSAAAAWLLHEPSWWLSMSSVGVPVGALVGLLIDYAGAPHRGILYSRSPQISRWRVAPLVGDRGYGVRLTKTF